MHVTSGWVIVALGAFTGVLLPTFAIMWRGAIRWTRVEDRLAGLCEDIKELVESKDRVHAEMLAQMRYDREATDRRLRFIEEYFMRAGRQLIERDLQNRH